jgi:hypothetical protein
MNLCDTIYDSTTSVGSVWFLGRECYIFFRKSHGSMIGENTGLEYYYIVDAYKDFPMNPMQMSINATLRISMREIDSMSLKYPEICERIIQDYVIRSVYEE